MTLDEILNDKSLNGIISYQSKDEVKKLLALVQLGRVQLGRK